MPCATASIHQPVPLLFVKGGRRGGRGLVKKTITDKNHKTVTHWVHPDHSADFIAAPGGGLDYGEITPDMGKAMRRQAGKIRLQRGVQNKDGSGWGLAHIEARHGKQIMALGYQSVPDFVARVARNIREVWQAAGIQLLVTVNDGRKDVMYIQLSASKNGDFYRVNSAFPVRNRDYELRHKMKKLWPESEPKAKAAGQPSVFAAGNAGSSSSADPNAFTQSDASVPTSVTGINAKSMSIPVLFLKGGRPGAAGLVKKTVTNRLGHQVTQWVKPSHPALAPADPRQQFEATALAHGGRAAYDAAKAAGATQLNYGQWVQVRTPAFKEWLGYDWGIRLGGQIPRAVSGGGAAGAHDGGVRGAGQDQAVESQRDRQVFADIAARCFDSSWQSQYLQLPPGHRPAYGQGVAGGPNVHAERLSSEVRMDAGNVRGVGGVVPAVHPPAAEPRVWYHGTKDDVAAFDLDHPNRKDSGWLGDGVYVTNSPDGAQRYAEAKRDASGRTGRRLAGENLLPLFVAAHNPYPAKQELKAHLRSQSREFVRSFTRYLQSQGFDAVVMRMDDFNALELAVFDPAGVKSAVGNNGGFRRDTAALTKSHLQKGFAMSGEKFGMREAPMLKAEAASADALGLHLAGRALLKAHISGFTRKDGTFVAEHDDKRAAAKQEAPAASKSNSRVVSNLKRYHKADAKGLKSGLARNLSDGDIADDNDRPMTYGHVRGHLQTMRAQLGNDATHAEHIQNAQYALNQAMAPDHAPLSEKHAKLIGASLAGNARADDNGTIRHVAPAASPAKVQTTDHPDKPKATDWGKGSVMDWQKTMQAAHNQATSLEAEGFKAKSRQGGAGGKSESRPFGPMAGDDHHVVNFEHADGRKKTLAWRHGATGHSVSVHDT